MLNGGVKQHINIFLKIAAASLIIYIVLYCIFHSSSWFQADDTPCGQVSLFFCNLTEQKPVSGVQIEFIRGHDYPDGKSCYQAITGEDGSVQLTLPFGEYTVFWQAEGYYSGCENITVGEEKCGLQKCLVPCIEGDSAYILAEWEEERDIDLCVYDEQNGRCIGVVSTLKDAGNCVYRDENGGNGYEFAYIKDVQAGSYTIYVRDSDSIAENHGRSMEQTGVIISIYTKSGLLYQKGPEEGESAVLWKCATLNNGEVTKQEEYIYDLEGYAWAVRDKQNPDSWISGADIKAEEVYYYKDSRLYKIRREEYDNRGCLLVGRQRIEYGIYNEIGYMTDGYRSEYAYDEQGNWLLYNYYQYKDGMLDYRNEYLYDEYGNWIQECIYKDGVLTHKIRQENIYDENGNMISQYVFNDLENPQTPSYGYEWEYDAVGNIIAEYRVEGGLLIYQYTSEWGEDGRLLRIKENFYESGKLESWEESEYDTTGNKVRCYYYNEENKLEKWEEHEYDASGNRIAEYIYTASGKLLIKTEMEYDDDGRKILSYTHNFGNMAEKEEWEYGANGEQLRIINRDYNDDGIYEWRKEVGYNKNGSIIFNYDYMDGVMLSGHGHRNEYDERGNETASYSFIDGDWIQKDEYTYEYEYDAVAGMMITNKYEDNFLITKTITIITDCTCNKQNNQSTYTAYIESEKINESHVEYPQIQGLKDLNLQRTINELLRNETINGAKASELMDNQLVYSTFVDFDDTDVSYEFKSGIGFTNESLASFWYSFTGYGEKLGWQGYVDRFYGLTINMKTGEKIHLTDFMEVDERLICSGIPDAPEPDYNSVRTPAFYTFKDAFMIYMTEDEYDPFHIFTPEYIIDLLKDTEGETMWYIDEKGENVIFHFDKCNYVSIPISELKDLIYPEYRKLLNIK